MQTVNKQIQVVDDAATGAQCRTERKAAKVTQAELAEAIGVCKSFMSDLERGKRKWGIDRVWEVNEFLHGGQPC